MTKTLIKTVFFLVIGLIIYNSVYFEKLSLRTSKSTENIDFKPIATKLYVDILKINAIDLDSLQIALSQNGEAAFLKYGNRLGIGNSAYFMANIEGEIITIDKSEIMVKSKNGIQYHLDLMFIFGNAIRDASKLVKLTEYKKTSEFNALSEALNEIIREQKIPIETAELKTGDKISAKVAFKLGKKDTDLSKLTFTPITIRK
jgi:archaellin